MKVIELTAFDLAQRFIGLSEVAGTTSNPQILAMLKLDQKWPEGDEVAWCSAFVNYICWLLKLPRSKSLQARSWLAVGSSVSLDEAQTGFDVVILQRGTGPQPGPEVLNAPGHVGFYAGKVDGSILLLAGNQGNSVNIAKFPVSQLLDIRRLV